MSAPEEQLREALKSLPSDHVEHLLKEYGGMKRAYFEGQADACGLRAGRFSEVMLRILQERLGLKVTPYDSKIENFTDAVRALEKTSKDSGPESFRVVLPRAIEFVYTLRNKRAIGHVGGDVDANGIDAATIVRVVDWSIAELIRVVHTVRLDVAQAIVNGLVQRDLIAIWPVGQNRRVLPRLNYPDQTLLLLYSEISGTLREEDLFKWVEHANLAYYRRDVLRRLHRDRLIEYDESSGNVMISPLGITRVESTVIPKVA